MNYTLENFIDFCDDMMIAEEGILSNHFQKRKDEKARRKAVNAKQRADREGCPFKKRRQMVQLFILQTGLKHQTPSAHRHLFAQPFPQV